MSLADSGDVRCDTMRCEVTAPLGPNVLQRVSKIGVALAFVRIFVRSENVLHLGSVRLFPPRLSHADTPKFHVFVI